MFLSKRYNGIYYLWIVDDDGRRQKVSTGCNKKSDAIKFLSTFKDSERKKRSNARRKSLIEFFLDYQEYAKSYHTIKTQHSVGNAFREFIRIIGNISLNEIGIKEIEKFLAKKIVEASEWTARKYYLHLASAFETAKRWNYISSNPFRRVQKPKTKELQPVFFTKDEMRTLLNGVTNTQFRNLYIIALFTGLRLEELLNLKWNDIDLAGKVIHVRNSATFTTKDKKNRSVPMNEQVYQVILSMNGTATHELVFHSKGRRLNAEWVSRKFKQYIRKLGLNDKLHFHSLRHTFASWLVQDGVSLYEVQKLLGHSNILVTQVYANLQPERLHSTVNRISIALN